MSYESWRISFQSSEQAARAAYDQALALSVQNAEMVAQIATLQQSVLKCSELVNVDGGTAIDWLIDNCDDLRSQATSTPQQHLRQIQADAVDEFLKLLFFRFSPKMDSFIHADGINATAEDFKKSAAKRQGGE